jgi:hypothetical protein
MHMQSRFIVFSLAFAEGEQSKEFYLFISLDLDVSMSRRDSVSVTYGISRVDVRNI